MSDTQTSEPADHLLRKRGYFYRPKAQGYTASVLEAGRYTMSEAVRRVAGCEGVSMHHVSDYPELAPAPTGDSAEQIVDKWTGEVLKRGYASSWHYGELLAALRQPPQPTGDVGLTETEREFIASALSLAAAHRERGDKFIVGLADNINAMAGIIGRLNSRLEQHVEHRDRQLRQMTAAFEAAEQALRTAREAHKENARLLGLVGHDLQGRIDASKLGAIFQCADRSRAAQG